jgi:hypothetical protein
MRAIPTATLRLSGLVAAPSDFSIPDLAALPDQVPDVGALVPGKVGGGVRLASLLAAAGATGPWLKLVAAHGYSIAVPRAAVESGVVAFHVGRAPLPEKQGGPIRFYVARAVECQKTPSTDAHGHLDDEVDACANVKGLVAIEVSAERQPDTHKH